jgi:carbon-monoxide dehydrogenase iron sulfur subunit
METVFVDAERCIGCLQCEYACAVEHSRSRDPAWAFMEDPPPRKRIHVEVGPTPASSFPNRCPHCDPAPCQLVCPTAAIARDQRHDVVLIDEVRCIACAMCAIVCPFDALTYHLAVDGGRPHTVALKCDGCIDRVRAGRVPACVESCKVGALVYGELNDLVRQGRRRETLTVLSAAAVRPTATPGIGTVGNWRSLSAAAAEVGRAGGAR